MDDLCLAVDIGGTKLAAGLVSREGALIESAHVATAAPLAVTAGAEELWGRLAGLVERI